MRAKKGGSDFKPGFDPRRNAKGRPASDVVIDEIKADIKVKLAQSLQKYYSTPVSEVTALSKDTSLSVGDRIALRFLVETSNKGDPARLSLLARIIGLEAAQKITIELSDEEKEIKDLSDAELSQRVLAYMEENKNGRSNANNRANRSTVIDGEFSKG